MSEKTFYRTVRRALVAAGYKGDAGRVALAITLETRKRVRLGQTNRGHGYDYDGTADKRFLHGFSWGAFGLKHRGRHELPSMDDVHNHIIKLEAAQ